MQPGETSSSQGPKPCSIGAGPKPHTSEGQHIYLESPVITCVGGGGEQRRIDSDHTFDMALPTVVDIMLMRGCSRQERN